MSGFRALETYPLCLLAIYSLTPLWHRVCNNTPLHSDPLISRSLFQYNFQEYLCSKSLKFPH